MRQLSEKNVLEKLGISDFSNMTREKAVSLFSMLPKMNPQVAIKALEQFPELTKIAIELGKEAIASENASLHSVYASLNGIISFLEEEYKKENQTPEEKKDILDNMIEVAKMIQETHREHQIFLRNIVSGVVVGMFTILVLAAQSMGSNSKKKH